MNAITGLDRRGLLQRALILAGAAAMPGGGFEALAAEAKGAARQLDPTRYALLIAVADTIVPKDDTPGALDANVPARFDALLRNWATPDRRADLVAALDKIDAKARGAEQKPFVELTLDKRAEVLSAHDAAALKVPAAHPEAAGNPIAKSPPVIDPNYGRPKQTPPAAIVSSATVKSKSAGNPFARGPIVSDPSYAKLKELIIVLFYLSEQALTHDLAWEHDPGSWDSSIPITPTTRPWGGAGAI